MKSVYFILLVCASMSAQATQYLTLEAAQELMFPKADAFVAQPICACDVDKRAIEKYAGVRWRAETQPVWRVQSGTDLLGWFVLDEVYGKHEFITYAVALSPNGEVAGLEILDYRETHGGEVRNEKWRAQFYGRQFPDPLKLGRDIDNISGATLSCKHMTEGVRRVLAIYDAALGKAATD